MNVLVSPMLGAVEAVSEPFLQAPEDAPPPQERRYRILKSDDTFGLFDYAGHILPAAGASEGLYHSDTRHLSRLDLLLGGARPVLLSSALSDDNLMLTSDLSNSSTADLAEALDHGVIHIQRSRFLWDGVSHERLLVRNFSTDHQRLSLELRFEADFADLFEVRGMLRPRRGERRPAAISDDAVILSYGGLDGEVRATSLRFDPAPTVLTAGRAKFELDLAPHGRATVFLEIACSADRIGTRPPRDTFFSAMLRAKRALRAGAARTASISSRNELFNEAARRSACDLGMLVTEKPTGPYPYAGIPWFSTAFGRDALITALLTLWLNPALARGVLGYLAQEQATEMDPASDAEPGKILHEMRGGEMAALGEVPFRRYYGSVDATPLFVMLAGAYLERTGDVAFAPSALAECRGGAGMDGPARRLGRVHRVSPHDGVGTGQSRLEG